MSKILAEVSPNENKNSTSTYSQTLKSKEEIIKTNIKYCKNVDLKITEQDKILHIMYWLPKMHKTKNCSTKPLSDVISKVFKMIFNHVESFHGKCLFYTFFNKY